MAACVRVLVTGGQQKSGQHMPRPEWLLGPPSSPWFSWGISGNQTSSYEENSQIWNFQEKTPNLLLVKSKEKQQTLTVSLSVCDLWLNAALTVNSTFDISIYCISNVSVFNVSDNVSICVTFSTVLFKWGNITKCS